MTPIWTMLDRKVQAAAVAAAARCSAGDELGLKRNVSEACSEAPALSEKRRLPRSLEETARVSRRPQSDRGSGFEKQRAPAGGVWDMLRSALRALSELIAGTYNLTLGSLPLFAVPWRAGAGVMTLFQANESETRMM